MNTDDHESPDRNRQVEGSDLGPEPDWLADAEASATDTTPHEPKSAAQTAADSETRAGSESEKQLPPRDQKREPARNIERAENPPAVDEPIEGMAVPVASAPAIETVRRERPWLFWAVPMVLLVITAVVAWFGSTQGLNNLTTWATLRFQHTGLLPARWAMLMWWIVLPLLGVFLVYSALPAGRGITRIKRTGPLLCIGLIASVIWIIAQHWRWDEVALFSMVISLLAILATYLLVALNKQISTRMQRLFAVVPLSAALGYSFMLITISWQNYSTEPFGARGTSILLLFLLLIVAAIFSFFIHDGIVGLVFTIWFVGVASHQWGNDAVISLGSIVAVILAAVITVLGFIMAMESHRPSLTTEISNRRGRVNFFRKSNDSPSEELP